MVSQEDIVWADSCLSKDPDELDIGWDSLKEALLETLNDQGDAPVHSKNKFSEEPMLNSSFGEETVNIDKFVKMSSMNEGGEPGSGDPITDEKTDDFWSRYNERDVFRPTYNECLRDLGNSDSELDVDPSSFQSFQLHEDDVFKIWDLGIPPMEDEFMKQLDKALSGNSVESTPSIPYPSKPSQGLNNESLDDLILGIADLSLSPNST